MIVVVDLTTHSAVQDRNEAPIRGNLEFDGNRVYDQEFFVASFPGIYEGIWKRMTEGAHKALLSCACVFFQDKAGGINGKHAEPCLCEFLATAADEGADRTWEAHESRGSPMLLLRVYSECSIGCHASPTAAQRTRGNVLWQAWPSSLVAPAAPS